MGGGGSEEVGICSLSKKALISRQARSQRTLAIIHGLMCWKAGAVSRLFLSRIIGGKELQKIIKFASQSGAR